MSGTKKWNRHIEILQIVFITTFLLPAFAVAFNPQFSYPDNNSSVFEIKAAVVSETAKEETAVFAGGPAGKNFEIKGGVGLQYVLMSDLNNYYGANFDNLPMPDKDFYPAHYALLADIEVCYIINNLKIGAKIGLLNCEAARVHFEFGTYYFPVVYVYSTAASMMPLQISIAYELNVNENNGGAGPLTFIFSLYSGYTWGNIKIDDSVQNDVYYGSFERRLNFYGGGMCSDLNAGFKYVDKKDKGWYWGGSAGYRYAMIPQMKADRDYTTLTTGHPLPVVRAGSKYNMNTDFRGISVVFDVGYQF